MKILCTDKTGTITQGIIGLDRALDPEGNPSDLVFQEAYINATFQTGLSNPLDQAITSARSLSTKHLKKIDEIPYDFVRKRLTVVVSEEELNSPGKTRIITKGALDKVLEICSTVLRSGQITPLESPNQKRLQEQFQEWSEQGFRVLGVARKFVEPKQAYSKDDERDLTFLGFFLFFDPPKEGIKETLAELEQLGIN